MGKFRRWLRATLGILRLGGLAAGALAVIFGLFQDVSGGTSFWSLTPQNWITIGLVLIALFGAATLLRHEYLLHAFAEIWGNEHAQKLLSDGIPPYRDVYLQYVARGDYATVNRFWNAGFVNVTDHGDRSDLHIACENGHGAIVRGIVERGGDPRRPNKTGHTPLMVSAARGQLKAAEALLEHDCAIDAQATSDGVSALYAAAANGHDSIVDLLIETGARLDSLDRDNMTPLMAAMARRNWDIATTLIDAGADLKRVDQAGASLADYATNFEAPQEIQERIARAGIAHGEPRFRSTGGGHTFSGKVTVRWKHDGEAD